MTVKELIEKLQAMPQEAEVIHVNYPWDKGTAFSEPMVFTNGMGECLLATQEVGKEARK